MNKIKYEGLEVKLMGKFPMKMDLNLLNLKGIFKALLKSKVMSCQRKEDTLNWGAIFKNNLK